MRAMFAIEGVKVGSVLEEIGIQLSLLDLQVGLHVVSKYLDLQVDALCL
jgi:hypothetical protein